MKDAGLQYSMEKRSGNWNGETVLAERAAGHCVRVRVVVGARSAGNRSGDSHTGITVREPSAMYSFF